MADKRREATDYLTRKTAPNGPSLTEHLSEVLLKILVEKPSNAVELFEHISAEVKSSRLAPKLKAVGEEDELVLKAAKQDKKVIKNQLQWAKNNFQLFKVLEEPPESVTSFPDLIDESNMWEWAGLSFGREQTYRLYLSIKNLSTTIQPGHESLRFWGRINTRSGDYFIVEGKAFEEKEDADPLLLEGLNGPNKYVYWVSKSFESGWEQLPQVTMKQIVIARQIRRLFTGDLNKEVSSYPPFPGKERELLRAQIARITHGTCVSPDGFFKEDDEAPEGERAQLIFNTPEDLSESEKFPKTLERLKSPTEWVHHELELNARGRVQAMPEQRDENDEPIDDPNEPKRVPALRTLDQDNDGKAWSFRAGPSGAGESESSHAIARSLVWPGSYAIALGKRFVNIYVGDGLKFCDGSYTLPVPPPLGQEWTQEEMIELDDLLVDPTPPQEEDEDA